MFAYELSRSILLICRDQLEGATLLNRTFVNSWLPHKKFILLYKATRDGFHEQQFARLCHNKGATITYIHTNVGYTIGGYNPDSWKPGFAAVSSSGFLFGGILQFVMHLLLQ